MMPRFSLRTAFVLLTVGSVLSIAVAAAVRGEAWAGGVMAAVGAAVLMLLVQAAFYPLTKLLAPPAAAEPAPEPTTEPQEEASA